MNNDKSPLNENITIGINPVIEALNSTKTVEKILISNSLKEKNLAKIIKLAKEKSVIIKKVDKRKLDLLSSNAVHQGVLAFLSDFKYSTIEEMINLAEQKNEAPFLVIADCIEDPHNMGAIIRSAECSGAHGVIIPQRRSSGITYIVSKSSAGAVEHIPITKVVNLSRTVDILKQKGLWVYCADMGGESWYDIDFSGGIALIIGNEGSGVSRILKEKSDFTVSLPMKGTINSLNASVAAGILMFEVVRQRSIR